jgi:hypothetical protein
MVSTFFGCFGGHASLITTTSGPGVSGILAESSVAPVSWSLRVIVPLPPTNTETLLEPLARQWTAISMQQASRLLVYRPSPVRKLPEAIVAPGVCHGALTYFCVNDIVRRNGVSLAQHDQRRFRAAAPQTVLYWAALTKRMHGVPVGGAASSPGGSHSQSREHAALSELCQPRPGAEVTSRNHELRGKGGAGAYAAAGVAAAAVVA